jgi:hypothetical protein
MRSEMGNLQIDLDRLGEWAIENKMQKNQGKRTAVSFTRAQVKDPLNCFGGNKELRKQAVSNM